MDRRDFVKRTTIASIGFSLTHIVVPFIPAVGSIIRKNFVTGGGYDASTCKIFDCSNRKAKRNLQSQ
jgi:hypothetical protein